jgi:hypothetical protein
MTCVPLLQQTQRNQTPAEEEAEEEEEETEELGHVDTYADYKPSKCTLPYTTIKTQPIYPVLFPLWKELLFCSSNIFLWYYYT